MNVSVVILNWNGEKYLNEFLPILLNNLDNVPDAEIVVADNGSTDGSLQLLAEKFPTVKVDAFEKNYGFAGGYNKALKNINSEYYVLLNSDVEVTKDWLSALYEFMTKNPDVAACQPKIRSYHRRNYFEYAGAAGGFIDKYGYPFCRGRIFGEVEEDLGQYDDIKDVFWASGACMFIRSADYWDAGGLDEEFFAHMEEIDLCWRLKSRGKRIVCVPQSVVYHIGGGTLNAEHPRKTFLNFRNNLIMLYKNLPQKNIKHVFDVRFYLDNLAALHLLLQGKYQNAKAVTDARTEFRIIQSKFSDQRKENILKSVNSLQKEISQHSLIYEFYIRRHKKYSEILPNEETANMQ